MIRVRPNLTFSVPYRANAQELDALQMMSALAGAMLDDEEGEREIESEHGCDRTSAKMERSPSPEQRKKLKREPTRQAT